MIAACAMTVSLYTAVADTCQNYTSLDQLIVATDPTFTTCTIGDKIFSNFYYSNAPSGGATPIGASAVQVFTVGPSGQDISGTNIGLEFQAAWDASAGQTNDANIGFTVTVAPGSGALIEDAGVAQLSGILPGSSATGSVSEDACANTTGGTPPYGKTPPCDPLGGTIQVLSFNSATNHTLNSNEVVFSPIGSISVEKDISANGGNGFIDLSKVEDTFSQTAVPEPRAMALLLSLGLAGLAFRKKLQGVRG